MKTRYIYTFFALLLSIFFTDTNMLAQSKSDVWDFGAEQLDVNQYNNRLDVNTINGWYPTSITPGSVSNTNVFPSSFSSVGGLSWNGGTNDRLRSANTSLTRYDQNLGGVTEYTGRLYQNGAGVEPPARYFTITLNEDDEVTLVTRADATGKMNFSNSVSGQHDSYDIGSTLVSLKFVAQTSGDYKIYDSSGKPSYYRIYRKPATYVTLSGTIDLTQATDIPAGYSIQFTNEAGKVWSATPNASNFFSIQLPAGNSYTPSLGNANGYIISNDDVLNINDNTTYNPVLLQVSLSTLSGNLTGLPSDKFAAVALTFAPSVSRPYIPKPQLNTTTGAYTVQLETNYDYTISAIDVNDYYITNNAINISADQTQDIVFASKPIYKITLNTTGLDATQLSELQVTFNNLDESGYSYSFTDVDNIFLRDGIYAISCSGLDQYPLQLAPTSNLKINGTDASKNLTFVPVTVWSFDDSVITSTTTAYKGMLFTGSSSYNEQAKGHLVLKNTDTAKVPVEPGQKIVISYYYAASFNVDGGVTVSTTSGSTSLVESVEFVYSGNTADYMTINNVSGTTYLTEVRVTQSVSYQSPITVGVDKDYHTINEALDAIRNMTRTATDTVQVLIDPGNYEEMLVIDIPNITLSNASLTPDIALLNKGVDISPNAVRITSYYGHGYNYFSMGANQKWNADALRVNRENGYTTYSNTGSGTTNGSYWNATVVVNASGFRADNIIFENSYNQYISKKESEDVVQEWTTGGKGTRPTTIGSTAVQDKSFVERAAAIAYTKGGDRSILNKCRIIGRQDSFFGAEGARVVAYKGSLMGATDYIFGGMTLVAYRSDLAMNTSEASADVAYITAAQQNTSRGFLMYECKITSSIPGTETASLYRSKPGYFGRPWQPTTSEVVFYNTTIETSNNPSYPNQSLILPIGWNNSLGGTSDKVYEYGTTEESGVNNSASRAAWSKVLASPTLTDNTDITTYNFTKGTDTWDPIPMLIAVDTTTGVQVPEQSNILIRTLGNRLFVSNVNRATLIQVYGVDGKQIMNENIEKDTDFHLMSGCWIVKTTSAEERKTAKIFIK
ncbi:MAG: pectinesterase family protein [Paludibacteraceae bacterium]